MKNLIKPGLILLLIFLALPSQANITTTVVVPIESKEMETNRLTNRLHEIKAMDKSSLTVKQKKALRNEVKEIKRTQNSGGVFLSVGAIIIIVLLLILLL